MLCAYLAGALLVGLLGNALSGLVARPGRRPLIAAVAVKEGGGWRGEGCCVSSPLGGAGFDHADDCCSASQREVSRPRSALSDLG